MTEPDSEKVCELGGGEDIGRKEAKKGRAKGVVPAIMWGVVRPRYTKGGASMRGGSCRTIWLATTAIWGVTCMEVVSQ